MCRDASGSRACSPRRRQEEETVALLEGILEEDPSNAYVFQLLGNSLRRTGNTELAREAFALAANPRPPSWPDPWKDARIPYQVGFAARLESALGRVSGPESAAAIAELEALRVKQPENVALLSNLGAAYCRAGRLPEGIATLQAALEERPEHFASLANLSLAYEASGDMGQALAVAERAVRAHPELVQAHMRLGTVLAKLGRHEEALASFQNARRLDQRSIGSVFWCGSMNGELGRWNEAALDFEAVLAAEPRMVGTWAWLAHARAEAGDLVSARAALAEAEKRAPNDPKLPEVRQRIDELERTASAR